MLYIKRLRDAVDRGLRADASEIYDYHSNMYPIRAGLNLDSQDSCMKDVQLVHIIDVERQSLLSCQSLVRLMVRLVDSANLSRAVKTCS
jgi:hypothetical protein